MPHPETVRHLETIYHSDFDPWEHLSSPYEHDKYAQTIGTVGDRKFQLGLEIGCGIGGLSTHLAGRCDRLLCMDCITLALARARLRLDDKPHVSVCEGTAPDDIPEINPDLLVLSEVLYFLTVEEIDQLGCWAEVNATRDAVIIVVVWTGPTGQQLSGMESMDRFSQALRNWTCQRRSFEGYCIDRFDRLDSQV